MPTTNSNMSLAASPREFTITVPIPQPVEGLDVPIVMISPCEFEILHIYRRTQDGDCDITLYNASVIIEFDDAQVDGSLEATDGAADIATPDGSASSNYTVAEGARLSVIATNLSTSLLALEIQIDCRKTIVPGNDV